MWRQAESYANQPNWYLFDVLPVIDSKTKQMCLYIKLTPGALNGYPEKRNHFIPENHPDYKWLSHFTEEDVTLRLPVRLTCIAPEVIGTQQPERLFDLLRIQRA